MGQVTNWPEQQGKFQSSDVSEYFPDKVKSNHWVLMHEIFN